MSNDQLISLFQKYLNRRPTIEEIKLHGSKNFNRFETEISNCNERKLLLSKKSATGKKIALLLSGHVRDNYIFKSFIGFVGRYDVDVFIHTWDTIGTKGTEMNLNMKSELLNVENTISQYPNLRKFKIENNKTYIDNIPKTDNIYFNFSSPEVYLLSQLYSINQSFKLMEDYSMENNINYDLVIRSRFDLEFTEFNLSDNLVDDVNKHDLIFVPNSDSKHGHLDNGTSCWACDKMYYTYGLKDVHIFEHTNVICDVFSYGSFNSMKEYCSVYDNFYKLNESFVDDNIKSIEKRKIKNNKTDNVYKLNQTKNGHLDSLYYVYCSYPERLLQKHLKDYMLIESKEIKIKFKR